MTNLWLFNLEGHKTRSCSKGMCIKVLAYILCWLAVYDTCSTSDDANVLFVLIGTYSGTSKTAFTYIVHVCLCGEVHGCKQT
jgi:hypothetical protein